ncbi:hypothetical protein [Actinomadura kijaniata]|uniref:hypothetical protein n=1 Tax=Actinomadura kijaniata TaxID=46161 RepID=UPI00082A22A0|nr:hypothetical protein [Actinomadura kijaniata]
MTTHPPLHPDTRAERRATPGPDVAAPPRRRRTLLVLLAYLAQVAVRLVASAGQTMPVATPDETGYLFAARVLSGGPAADLSYGTVYRGGYPLLLTPAHWLSDDPQTVYRLIQAENALISALMLPLALVLLHRCGLDRRAAFLVGNATALLTGVVFFAEFALTDAVLPVVVLGWLLLVHSWLTAGARVTASPARVALYGAGASALAAYSYVCHTRGVILLVVQAALVLTAAVARWRSRGEAASAAAVLVGVALAGTRLNHSLLPAMYPNGDNDLGGNLLLRLTSLDGWGWTLSLATGQVWYQLAATGGLAGVGLVALAMLALRRDAPGRLRALALAVVAVVAGIALATSAALPDEQRVGNYAYGRYLACVTPVLFAVGCAVLLRLPRRAAAWAAALSAALLAGSAVVVGWHAGDRLARYTFTPYDFPEISFLTWDWTAFRLERATLAGLVLLGLAVLASRLRGLATVTLTALCALVSTGMIATANERIGAPLVREYTAATDVRSIAGPATTPVVAVDDDISWRLKLPLYYWLNWTATIGFDGDHAPPREADLVLVYWNGKTPAESTWKGGAPPGWRIVDRRTSPNDGWVAWRRSG